MLKALLWSWFGLVLGVSFLATPVKFQAPSLTLPVALEVGHVTFQLLNRVEWVLAGTLIVGMVIGWRQETVGQFDLAMTAVVVGIVALQTFWLLPSLHANTQATVSGENPSDTLHHLFVGIEVLKVATLAIWGWRA
jgi:hypothetical protein